jgi:Protein of unknown function, DUF481.
MPFTRSVITFSCFIALTSLRLYGQASASSSQPQPDVLIFTNGEKLIGHLESATGSSVVFKSDMAGEVTVDWAKIQELHSSRKFAAIPKGTRLRNRQDAAKVPQGAVTMTGQQIKVSPSAPGAPQTFPVGSVGNLVEGTAFEKAFERTSFFHGWRGGATGGISLTEATQKNRTFTAALNLTRSVPDVNWLDLRSRTLFDLNEAYGKLSEPGTPDVKTSLFHAGLEQDWYLSPRVFAFAHGLWDHSFSQGLDLQQIYGPGLGFVVFKRANEELDLKVSADYINQRYAEQQLLPPPAPPEPSRSLSLFGTTFSETYTRTFAHGIFLNQQAGITPTWNDLDAYFAFASAALTFPVYHRFGLTLGALDSFLNNPPPTFKKNSFQFTAGATYSFQ